MTKAKVAGRREEATRAAASGETIGGRERERQGREGDVGEEEERSAEGERRKEGRIWSFFDGRILCRAL